MQPTTYNLECQLCGNTMSCGEPRAQCQVCGSEMIEAPFFSVRQTMQLAEHDVKNNNRWVVLIILILLGVVAAVAMLAIKFPLDKKPTAVKQETSPHKKK